MKKTRNVPKPEIAPPSRKPPINDQNTKSLRHSKSENKVQKSIFIPNVELQKQRERDSLSKYSAVKPTKNEKNVRKTLRMSENVPRKVVSKSSEKLKNIPPKGKGYLGPKGLKVPMRTGVMDLLGGKDDSFLSMGSHRYSVKSEDEAGSDTGRDSGRDSYRQRDGERDGYREIVKDRNLIHIDSVLTNVRRGSPGRYTNNLESDNDPVSSGGSRYAHPVSRSVLGQGQGIVNLSDLDTYGQEVWGVGKDYNPLNDVEGVRVTGGGWGEEDRWNNGSYGGVGTEDEYENNNEEEEDGEVDDEEGEGSDEDDLEEEEEEDEVEVDLEAEDEDEDAEWERMDEGTELNGEEEEKDEDEEEEDTFASEDDELLGLRINASRSLLSGAEESGDSVLLEGSDDGVEGDVCDEEEEEDEEENQAHDDVEEADYEYHPGESEIVVVEGRDRYNDEIVEEEVEYGEEEKSFTYTTAEGDRNQTWVQDPLLIQQLGLLSDKREVMRRMERDVNSSTHTTTATATVPIVPSTRSVNYSRTATTITDPLNYSFPLLSARADMDGYGLKSVNYHTGDITGN